MLIQKNSNKSSTNNKNKSIFVQRQAEISNIINGIINHLSSKRGKKYNEPDIDIESYISKYPEFVEYWEFFCKGGMLTAKETEQNEIFEQKKQIVKCVRTYATQSWRQYSKDTWTTHKGSLPDIQIIRHLLQLIWLAVRAGWYPPYFLSDIDILIGGLAINIFERPDLYEKAVELVINNLNLQPDQFLLYTSPHCHLHLLFRPVYHGKPVTIKLGHTILEPYIGAYEIYPQQRRKIRLPLGKMQYRLAHPEPGVFVPVVPDANKLDTFWIEEFKLIKKIKPLELSTLPRLEYIKLPHHSDNNTPEKPKKPIPLSLKAKAEALIKNGPMGSFDSDIFTIACYYARMNSDFDEAKFYTKAWADHWYRTAEGWNLSEWNKLSKDISRRVQYVYDTMEQTQQYPDYVHNQEGFCYKQDISLVKELEQQLFSRRVQGVSSNPYINRARLFRFINYLRPRLNHEWIYIPYWVWIDIVGDIYEYIAFRDRLEQKGIIEISHLYAPDEFSKSIKLLIKLPGGNESDIVKVDGRAVQEYDVAAVVANPDISCSEFMELTGGSERTYFYAKERANLVQ